MNENKTHLETLLISLVGNETSKSNATEMKKLRKFIQSGKMNINKCYWDLD